MRGEFPGVATEFDYNTCVSFSVMIKWLYGLYRCIFARSELYVDSEWTCYCLCIQTIEAYRRFFFFLFQLLKFYLLLFQFTTNRCNPDESCKKKAVLSDLAELSIGTDNLNVSPKIEVESILDGGVGKRLNQMTDVPVRLPCLFSNFSIWKFYNYKYYCKLLFHSPGT